jgi:hypothetical protein
VTLPMLMYECQRGMQGTLGGMALVYMYTATDQGFVDGCVGCGSFRWWVFEIASI